MSGLENLSSVDGGLYIDFNDALESIEGLGGITSVGDRLSIHSNPRLATLAGLNNLVSVVQSVTIRNNVMLESLSELGSLASAGGDLTVSLNDALVACSCGLTGLISGDPPVFSGVGGSTRISSNNPDGFCTSPEVVLANPCKAVSNEEESTAPEALSLAAYPNPTSSSLTVRYMVPVSSPVRVAVYDVLGREVAVPVDEVQSVGQYETRLSQAELAAGTYVVRIEAGDEVLTQRVAVVR